MGQRQSRSRDSYMRKIDFMFYHEKEIREAVYRARMTNGISSGTLKLINTGGISDPTAMQAVSNLTPLKKVVISDGEIIECPERWLEVIDKTYRYCATANDCRLEVAKRRYRSEDYRKTCIDLNISDSTRRRLLELVKMYAALQAVQLNLIYV